MTKAVVFYIGKVFYVLGTMLILRPVSEETAGGVGSRRWDDVH